MADIVTLTMNPAVDKSTEVPKVAPNRKLRCETPRWEPGGGGLNVSRALRRLGNESLALFTSGGPMGEVLQQLLQDEGVEARPMEIQSWTRENLAVQEEEEDQQFRFDMPGPELSREEWESCLDTIDSVAPSEGFLVASGSLPPGVPADFYGRVAALAADRGCRMILDSSGEALKAGVERSIYLVKPNLRELGTLAERNEFSADYEREQMEAARDLVRERGPEAVVVSMGSAGAILVTAETKEKIPTPTVPIRSRVGAGDSMVAGIVHGLQEGYDLPGAVRLGVAAGAAAVKTPGSELCRKEDVDSLFAGM